MIYKNNREKVEVNCGNGVKKTFFIGEKISSYDLDFTGLKLDGNIIEIITGEDKETDNIGDDIAVCFDLPEDDESIKKIEKHFSKLYQEPKSIDDIALDYVLESGDDIVSKQPREYIHKILYKSPNTTLNVSQIKKENINIVESIESFMERYKGICVKGIITECKDWIHAWGNGGGDTSTEECIKNELDELDENCNIDLITDKCYDVIVNYTHDEFESADIVKSMLKDSLENAILEGTK